MQNLKQKIEKSFWEKIKGPVSRYAVLGLLIGGVSCGNGVGGGRITQIDSQNKVYQEVYQETGVKSSTSCYPDKDGDGFPIKGGESYFTKEAGPCLPGYAAPQIYEGKIVFDCNDANQLIYPGAKEECNGADDNCDGKSDENLTGVCYSICGEGKIVCSEGRWGNCNAPLPEEEICNCKDDDCNGKTDELPAKNEVYCSTGKVEEDVCLGCEWKHQVYECPKWICIDQKIGTITDGGEFTVRDPLKEEEMKSCIPEWCCKDGKGVEWGCEGGQEYLKNTCSCITNISEFSKEGGEYDPKKERADDSFYFESGACPKHNQCDKETSVKVTFANQERLPLEVWINSYYYGSLPTKKTVLNPKESYTYNIDESLIPEEGAEIEFCTSRGCSEKIYLECGDKKQFRVDSLFGFSVGYDEEGKLFYFNPKLQDKCDLETAVEITFSNHKTLDLAVWINSVYGSFRPEREIILGPGEEHTFYLNNPLMPKEGAIIWLCTSSYGCSGEIPLSCGAQREFRVDWNFGRKER